MKYNFVPYRLKNKGSEIRIALARLGCFHSETENVWLEKRDELDWHVNEIVNNSPKEEQEEVVDDYSWDLEHYHVDFPNTHRRSLLITIYSFLEIELNQMCEDISESVFKNKITIYDFKGSGIKRAHLFLTKFAKFDWSRMNDQWAYIKNVNLLRNRIVHCAGELPKDETNKLNKFILKNSYLSGEPGHYVSIKSDFIVEYLKMLKIFFEKLNVEVQKFINNVTFSIDLPKKH